MTCWLAEAQTTNSILEGGNALQSGSLVGPRSTTEEWRTDAREKNHKMFSIIVFHVLTLLSSSNPVFRQHFAELHLQSTKWEMLHLRNMRSVLYLHNYIFRLFFGDGSLELGMLAKRKRISKLKQGPLVVETPSCLFLICSILLEILLQNRCKICWILYMFRRKDNRTPYISSTVSLITFPLHPLVSKAGIN